MVAAVSWDLPDPFVIEISVCDAHIDDLGHTNNAVYLSFCEQVAWAHSEARGLGIDQYHLLDRAMAVQSTRLRYFQPSFAGEELLVANWIVMSDGRLRVTRRYQIMRAADAATLVRGESDFVCIEVSSGRPRRMPEAFAREYVIETSVAGALAQTNLPAI